MEPQLNVIRSLYSGQKVMSQDTFLVSTINYPRRLCNPQPFKN